jgi:AcrR family transcriptional regulator
MFFSMPEQVVRLTREALAAAAGDSWSAADVDAAIELLESANGKLPAGTRKLPADLVAAIQWERILAAMLKAASKLGYRALNVSDVLELAGISRPTFYLYFANKEDCFLAAFDSAAARLLGQIKTAAAGGDEDWRSQLRAGLEAVLRFAAAEPDAARALIVESRGASPLAQQRRETLLDLFSKRIDDLVKSGQAAGAPPPTASAAVVGGIEATLFSRLYEDRIDEIEALLPTLMYFAVLPYAGPEAAGEELAAGTTS